MDAWSKLKRYHPLGMIPWFSHFIFCKRMREISATVQPLISMMHWCNMIIEGLINCMYIKKFNSCDHNFSEETTLFFFKCAFYKTCVLCLFFHSFTPPIITHDHLFQLNWQHVRSTFQTLQVSSKIPNFKRISVLWRAHGKTQHSSGLQFVCLHK